MSPNLQITAGAADVAATVSALQSALARRGVEVFATIDHAAGAAAVGLELADEVVVIFGNPAVGTPLMQADARAGLDLPLRILIWSDAGSTRIGYEDPHALAARYDVTGADKQLDGMAALLAQLAAEIAQTA